MVARWVDAVASAIRNVPLCARRGESRLYVYWVGMHVCMCEHFDRVCVSFGVHGRGAFRAKCAPRGGGGCATRRLALRLRAKATRRADGRMRTERTEPFVRRSLVRCAQYVCTRRDAGVSVRAAACARRHASERMNTRCRGSSEERIKGCKLGICRAADLGRLRAG